MKKVNTMKLGLRKKLNKGFSLMELIIAIAILGIVVVSVGIAMTNSSRVYSRTSVEAQMQSEAQLVANSISELAIDASNASNEVTSEWSATLQGADTSQLGNVSTTKGEILILDATENVGTAASPDYTKVQYLVTRSKDEDKKELYLARRQQDSSGNWGVFSNFDLLGNYVGAFNVDTDRVEADNLLVFDLGYEKNNRRYTGKYQVLMRNKAYAKEEPEENPSEKDIKLIANIQPKYVYLAVRQGAINDYYEGAVVDAAPYKKSIIQPVTFKTTFVSNQSENLLRSKWELTGTGTSEMFKLATANAAEGAPNGLITTNSLVINTTKDELKSMSYDSFNVNYSISTKSKEGNVVSSDLVTSQVRMLRIKDITVSPTSGFSTDWKTSWTGEKTEGVDGYAYTDSTGKVIDVGLNAIIDCTDWVPYKGGVIWKLEKWSGTNWENCSNANFAKLAVMESNNSTLNTLQFGKSAMNGQKYKVTATSKFDEDYFDELIIGIGTTGGGSDDGFYSRGFYIDLSSWFEIEQGVTTVIDRIEIGSQGDSWEAVEELKPKKNPQTGRWELYIPYDSAPYTQAGQRVDFYNGKGEIGYYIYDASGNKLKSKDGQELIKYHMKPVVVTKEAPTNEVLVVAKGGSKDVRVKTSYYNLVNKDYFGIFAEDTETNLNRPGMTDWHKDIKVETTSSYGDVYRYVDKMSVSVTPKTSNKDYNPCPIRFRLAALDYYNLTRKNDGDTASYDTPTYTDYYVYIANVEGANVFIPGPGTKGNDAQLDGKGLVWDSATSTKKNISGYDANGNVVANMGKVYVSGGKTKLDYNGTTYTYNSTYHYWKK